MESISCAELKKLIEEKADYILIDVREKIELKNGIIPTSHHIPLQEFLKSLTISAEDFKKKHGFSLSKKDRLILYCRSGNRSEFATKMALKLGFNAENFVGSILEWSKHDPKVKSY
ncbi:MAG: rhodanese-like domain-containing protein [Nanoarchaeota archaeon]